MPECEGDQHLRFFITTSLKNLDANFLSKTKTGKANLGKPEITDFDFPDRCGKVRFFTYKGCLMCDFTSNFRAVLLTTHYMDEAKLLADWIVITHNGRLFREGTLESLKRDLGLGYVLSIDLKV